MEKQLSITELVTVANFLITRMETAGSNIMTASFNPFTNENSSEANLKDLKRTAPLFEKIYEELLTRLEKNT